MIAAWLLMRMESLGALKMCCEVMIDLSCHKLLVPLNWTEMNVVNLEENKILLLFGFNDNTTYVCTMRIWSSKRLMIYKLNKLHLSN